MEVPCFLLVHKGSHHIPPVREATTVPSTRSTTHPKRASYNSDLHTPTPGSSCTRQVDQPCAGKIACCVLRERIYHNYWKQAAQASKGDVLGGEGRAGHYVGCILLVVSNDAVEQADRLLRLSASCVFSCAFCAKRDSAIHRDEVNCCSPITHPRLLGASCFARTNCVRVCAERGRSCCLSVFDLAPAACLRVENNLK